MAEVPLPRKRPPSSSELKTAAEEAASKQTLGDTTKACVLGALEAGGRDNITVIALIYR